MSTVVVTLIGKPECHLCDTARAVVHKVIAEIAAECSVSVVELSLHNEPALLAKHKDEIPVVLIDGHVHAVLHVEAGRLRSAILEAAT